MYILKGLPLYGVQWELGPVFVSGENSGTNFRPELFCDPVPFKVRAATQGLQESPPGLEGTL